MSQSTVSEPDADEEPHVFLVPYGSPKEYVTPEWEDSDDGCSRELAGSMVLYFYDEVAVHRMIHTLLHSLESGDWQSAIRIPCGIELYRDNTTAPTAFHGKPTHGADGLDARERAVWEAWKKTLEKEDP